MQFIHVRCLLIRLLQTSLNFKYLDFSSVIQYCIFTITSFAKEVEFWNTSNACLLPYAFCFATINQQKLLPFTINFVEKPRSRVIQLLRHCICVGAWTRSHPKNMSYCYTFLTTSVWNIDHIKKTGRDWSIEGKTQKNIMALCQVNKCSRRMQQSMIK